MKRLSFLVLILLGVACHTNSVKPNTGCIVTGSVSTGGSVVHYYYNSANQLISNIRTSGGGYDSLTFTYNRSGTIATTVEYGFVSTYSYSNDGKLSSYILEKPGIANSLQTYTYHWYADSVVVSVLLGGDVAPFEFIKYTFSGENITETSYKFLTPTGVLSETDVLQYSNFDTGISPYYLANEKSPGNADLVSKNNPGQTISTVTLYTNGVAGTPDVTTTTSNYTYNNSNAVITHIDTDSSSGHTNTWTYTYSGCD